MKIYMNFELSINKGYWEFCFIPSLMMIYDSLLFVNGDEKFDYDEAKMIGLYFHFLIFKFYIELHKY